MATTPKTFKEAYQLLQEHAETLRNAEEPDIDNLLEIVKQSVEAYKVCQQRITAVEKALDATLKEVGKDVDEESP